MSKPGFCQHDAGVLKNDKLSDEAKYKFIQDVKTWLLQGESNLPIPCGPKFPAVQFADRIELENEEKYPDWHKNVLGMYEKIAKSLDIQSQFTILPICDPLALAVALQVDPPKLNFPEDFILLSFALPVLSYRLGFELPAELALKFPSILKVPPKPPFELPIPPDFNIDAFIDLYKFANPYIKFPEMIIGMMPQMPQLLLKFLAFDFKAVCDVVLESKLFGDYKPEEATVWAVSQAVLASKTAECLVIALTSATIGSASAGITGAEGTFFGYTPPPMETQEDNRLVRDRIVAAANGMIGESWSKDFEELKSTQSYVDAKLKYTQFLLPNIIFPSPPTQIPLTNTSITINTKRAFEIAKVASSCGMFVRGCYYAAGAKHPFFRGKYQPASAIAGLVKICDQNQANLFDWNSKTIPALKRGDAILVQRPNEPGSEHVLILTKDYPGGLNSLAEGVEGGRSDPANQNTTVGTAIAAGKFQFTLKNGRISAGRPNGPEPRQILRIMDGERMVLGPPNNNE